MLSSSKLRSPTSTAKAFCSSLTERGRIAQVIQLRTPCANFRKPSRWLWIRSIAWSYACDRISVLTSSVAALEGCFLKWESAFLSVLTVVLSSREVRYSWARRNLHMEGNVSATLTVVRHWDVNLNLHAVNSPCNFVLNLFLKVLVVGHEAWKAANIPLNVHPDVLLTCEDLNRGTDGKPGLNVRNVARS